MLVKELLEQVSISIASSNEEVAQRVVTSLVEKELDIRKNAFITVLAKLDEARKAGHKIKPDGETYAIDPATGVPSKEPIRTYSKAKKEELEKNQAEVKKLEEALDKALSGDWTKVKELSK